MHWRPDHCSPRHVAFGLWNDEELNKQFKDFAILGGGVYVLCSIDDGGIAV